MRRTIAKAWHLMPASRRRRFVQVSMLAVLVSFLEAASALAIAVLLALVLQPGDLPDLPVLGDAGEIFPGATYESFTLWACAVFAGFFVLRAALFLFQQYATTKVVENTAVVLGEHLVEGYLSMPYEWYVQRNSSELLRNSWNNVQEVNQGVFQQLAELVAHLVLVVAMVGVLLATSVTLTVGAVGVLGTVLLSILALVQPRLKAYGQLRQQATREALKALQQAFGGARDLKILGAERVFSRTFGRARATMADLRVRTAVFSYLPRVAIEVAFFGLLLTGVALAVTRGDVTDILSSLGVFAYAGLRLQPSLQKISISVNQLRFNEPAVDELMEGLDDLDRAVADRHAADAVPGDLEFADELRFDGVTYRYPGTDVDALAGVDLRVPRGSSLGIVGVTGGGKSTLLDLMCGLITPTSGTVTIDGVDLEDRTRAWHRAIGVVHQQSFLIDDTLRANIAFGVPPDRIDDDRIASVVRSAQLEDVIEWLPEGLETVVGERGVKLSGGQRQRVTLARALYRRPKVLILDEGTASLDNETERLVIDDITTGDDVTLVMVAHRLTTVEDCDTIVMLDGGRVVATGSYQQLLETSAAFRQLVHGLS